jgi:hypothetical protein
MWRPNLPAILKTRTAYWVDLLGEGGLSVQTILISGAIHRWPTALAQPAGAGIHRGPQRDARR